MNHKEIIPEADIGRISAYLNESLNPLDWLILSIQFVSRGIEFQKQLKLNFLVFSSDETGCEYVTLSHAAKEQKLAGRHRCDRKFLRNQNVLGSFSS